MKLVRSGNALRSVFDLLGQDEDDMTAALGFTLTRSPSFTAALLACLGVKDPGPLHDAQVRLQSARDDHGRTDVELEIGTRVFVLLEAKRGPQLPSPTQLALYAPLLAGCSHRDRRLVALTSATPAFAQAHLASAVHGIPVLHRSWREVRRVALAARSRAGAQERRWIDEFATYLEGLVQMETRYSNMAYVVSLGASSPAGWAISWRDIVEKRGRYFYPVGKRWPDPPNYLAFRYDGQLRSIHHVESFELFTDPHALFPEIPAAAWAQHYCFRLGPAIQPGRAVKNGPKVQRAMRFYCMLDTLLTCATLTEALQTTRARQHGDDLFAAVDDDE
jgi:hypothetical protein